MAESHRTFATWLSPKSSGSRLRDGSCRPSDRGDRRLERRRDVDRPRSLARAGWRSVSGSSCSGGSDTTTSTAELSNPTLVPDLGSARTLPRIRPARGSRNYSRTWTRTCARLSTCNGRLARRSDTRRSRILPSARIARERAILAANAVIRPSHSAWLVRSTLRAISVASRQPPEAASDIDRAARLATIGARLRNRVAVGRPASRLSSLDRCCPDSTVIWCRRPSSKRSGRAVARARTTHARPARMADANGRARAPHRRHEHSFTSAAAPLLVALGLRPPSQVEATEPAGRAFAATVHGRRAVVAVARDAMGRASRSVLAASRSRRRCGGRPPGACSSTAPTSASSMPAALYARRYLEFDLDLALDDAASVSPRSADASARDGARPPADAIGVAHALVAASDRHATGVCRSLRDGVLTASARRARRARSAACVRRRRGRSHDSFEQALTIVYRMLFLLFAEARALVPLWHPVYRESYSVESLRDMAERAATRAGTVGRAARDRPPRARRLPRGRSARHAVQRPPVRAGADAARRARDLDDEAARTGGARALDPAGADRAGRERIAYRDLGVEQLGAVYETLLDYAAARSSDRPRGRRPLCDRHAASGSGVRKATGTFYTPQPIADYLVRRTLGPLVRDARPNRISQLRIVDPGDGQRRVSRRRLPVSRRGVRSGARSRRARAIRAISTTRERVAIRRTIAERCLYGVDLNPMAVQLARLSLWLATLAADRPLSFLDHRLQIGDSLLGAWLASLRQRRISPRVDGAARVESRRLPLFDDDHVRRGAARGAAGPLLARGDAERHARQVRAKERALAALTGRDACCPDGSASPTCGARRGFTAGRRRRAAVRVRRRCPTRS